MFSKSTRETLEKKKISGKFIRKFIKKKTNPKVRPRLIRIGFLSVGTLKCHVVFGNVTCLDYINNDKSLS